MIGEGFFKEVLRLFAIALILWFVLSSFSEDTDRKLDTVGIKIDVFEEKVDREIQAVSERLVRVETMLEELTGREEENPKTENQ